MATEQVFDWIKNGLQLSRTVNNFEADFANGYLFAEILNSYGPLVDLAAFSKKNNKEAKV
jgi:ribosomal protein S16